MEPIAQISINLPFVIDFYVDDEPYDRESLTNDWKVLQNSGLFKFKDISEYLTERQAFLNKMLPNKNFKLFYLINREKVFDSYTGDDTLIDNDYQCSVIIEFESNNLKIEDEVKKVLIEAFSTYFIKISKLANIKSYRLESYDDDTREYEVESDIYGTAYIDTSRL